MAVHREDRAAVSFCFFFVVAQVARFFVDLLFVIALFFVVTVEAGDYGNFYGCLQFLTSEERRHTATHCR
jgi:hypothetical protein